MEGKLDQLSLIAKKYPTDKFGHHNYTPIYEQWFYKWRFDKLSLLEVGVGGYHHPDKGGGSLKMWKEYFPASQIYGIDLYDKSLLNEDRITTFMGSQIDEEFLKDTLMKFRDKPKIIIDDGSHINPYTLRTFELLFPKLQSGGLYIIEDTHTSYWEEIAVDGTNFHGGNHPHTVMNWFKSLTDHLNYEHSVGRVPVMHKGGVSDMIKGISFYKEIIVIEKI